MSLLVQLVPALEGVAPGDTVAVEGDEAHHALHVRRLRPGEPMALTDGRGTRAAGVVAEVDRRRFGVVVETVDRVPRPEPSVTVIQALAKGDRGELAVQLLTEVGVDRIVPWAASRSVTVWRGERAAKSLARWRATAREAAKQSRRVWFPEVAELQTTAEAATTTGGCDLTVVLHEEATAGLPTVPAAALSVAVVVGPEGGLTDEEVAAFTAVGARPTRLGPEVLRTSTAGLAAVSALLSTTPRWR